MKDKIFLTILSVFVGTLPIYAGITPQESTSAQYLHNYGYSQSMVELVQASKAAVNGESYITEDEAKHANDPTFVKFVRKVFTYFDPALDSGSFKNHDIKYVPTIDDL